MNNINGEGIIKDVKIPRKRRVVDKTLHKIERMKIGVERSDLRLERRNSGNPRVLPDLNNRVRVNMEISTLKNEISAIF